MLSSSSPSQNHEKIGDGPVSTEKPTRERVDIDSLLRSCKYTDCYDDDVVSKVFVVALWPLYSQT